ncbi:hypothetical protein Pyn_36022 [Prunus yedoensis var. nudiflora]|uniref:Secreted protein n=1 Tax=Prunus yedoensis var. nudiflora TaxID=2094558 RepID=A0A314ZN82_PRUYE|nr:hypothetical protein Pyn_36022 [Prunus yedoensis var. nudiflora]
MSVVNLVILLENVACVLVHEDWVVEGAEVHLLDAAEVLVMMVMDAGAIVRVGEDLLHDAVVSHLLDVDEATVGLLHIALLVVLHLMPMGTKLELEQTLDDLERMMSLLYYSSNRIG